MTRHIIDQPRPADDAPRLREFLRIDRQTGLQPAPRAVHQRPLDARGAARLREFLRIDRGILR